MSRDKINSKVKTRLLQRRALCNYFQVIRLMVTEGLNTLDQIVFNAEVHVKAGGYKGAVHV